MDKKVKRNKKFINRLYEKKIMPPVSKPDYFMGDGFEESYEYDIVDDFLREHRIRGSD